MGNKVKDVQFGAQYLKRRQFGAERNLDPLPAVPPKPSNHRITLGRFGIVLTVLFWVIYLVATVMQELLNAETLGFRFVAEAIFYVIVVTFLVFSALMYLIARHGALVRYRDHTRVPRIELDEHFEYHNKRLTVLIPSYAEEPEVIEKTIWSAALQEYPKLSIVLLIDDSPNQPNPEAAKRLESTRFIPQKIMAELAEPQMRFNTSQQLYADIVSNSVNVAVVAGVISEYRWAANWLNTRHSGQIDTDHVDYFYRTQIFEALASDLELIALALETGLGKGEIPSSARLRQLYLRLIRIFGCEISSFERKQFVSLSQESNKAMNLNSYIVLIGKTFMIEDTPMGQVLKQISAKDERASIVVPDSDYILTLDADSLLLKDYALRLIFVLEEPKNNRIAVIQTPYSSFRAAPSRLERMAAATTDLQHNLHQGMTEFSATFWVGANAIIRKKALDDIEEIDVERGFEIKRYVQDRTVIEDTESSIDLVAQGWNLYNYPERLSYSATPPDFGSLIVQRRRWANGGLLILPKFIRGRRDRKRKGERVRNTESWLRVNYMASIAWASIGLVFLLAYPYDGRLLSPFVVLAALPYFLTMADDLKTAGYKRTDVFRIYGFNLILLPVNLSGVFKSIEQAITGKKIPFARTPKVKDRTASPIWFVVAPFLILGYSIFTFVRDYEMQNWGNATFAAFNAILTLYAIIAFIGLPAVVVDIFVGAKNWIYVDDNRKKKKSEDEVSTAAIDWRAVLYHGSLDVPAPYDYNPASAEPVYHTRSLETALEKGKSKSKTKSKAKTKSGKAKQKTASEQVELLTVSATNTSREEVEN